MKRTLLTLITFVAGAGIALAGPYNKNPIPMDPCNAFLDGLEVGGYVAGIFPDGDLDSAIGGGISLSYFLNPTFGVDVSYAAYDTNPDVYNVVTADLVCRPWAEGHCLSPYFLVGGGLISDGENEGLYRAGIGLEYWSENFLGGVGIFGDGTYNWINDDDDSVFTRLGFRFSF